MLQNEATDIFRSKDMLFISRKLSAIAHKKKKDSNHFYSDSLQLENHVNLPGRKKWKTFAIFSSAIKADMKPMGGR